MKAPFSKLLKQLEQNLSPARDCLVDMQHINASLQHTIEQSKLSIVDSHHVLRQLNETAASPHTQQYISD